MYFLFGKDIRHKLPRHEVENPGRAINPEGAILVDDGYNTLIQALKGSPLPPKKPRKQSPKPPKPSNPVKRSKTAYKPSVEWGKGGHIYYDLRALLKAK